MESSIAIRNAVAAPDLADVVAREGPFATVYIGTDPAVENAAQRGETAWRALRRDLEAAGAPTEALQDVGALVGEAHLWGAALAVVAMEDGVAHVETGQHPPPRDVARWASLPSLVPILEWRQSMPPHVAVLADRTGADLMAFRPGAPDLERDVRGADGSHIHKGKPGGWSQRRFQQAAENLWEQNARDVAGELTRLVKEVDARLVVAAGDGRALGLIREHLPTDVLDLLTTADGTPQRQGSDDELTEEVERIVAVAVDQETASLLDTFREELGQGDRAAAGATNVLQALSKAQTEVLLVYDHPDDDRRAWFGPEPVHAATTETPLREIGVDPVQGRLVDVAVRAALRTGARIRVVPGEADVPDGLGAVLRWS